jgi:hypothetical protein
MRPEATWPKAVSILSYIIDVVYFKIMRAFA